MSFDEATYDLIDRYLRGELAGAERTAFEARLSADPALKKEADDLRLLVEALNMQGKNALKKQIGLIGAAIPAKDFAGYTPSINAAKAKSPVPKKGFRHWLKKWWFLPVTVVTIPAAIIAWQHYAPQKAGNDGLEAPAKDSVPPMADSLRENRVQHDTVARRSIWETIWISAFWHTTEADSVNQDGQDPVAAPAGFGQGTAVRAYDVIQTKPSTSLVEKTAKSIAERQAVQRLIDQPGPQDTCSNWTLFTYQEAGNAQRLLVRCCIRAKLPTYCYTLEGNQLTLYSGSNFKIGGIHFTEENGKVVLNIGTSKYPLEKGGSINLLKTSTDKYIFSPIGDTLKGQGH